MGFMKWSFFVFFMYFGSMQKVSTWKFTTTNMNLSSFRRTMMFPSYLCSNAQTNKLLVRRIIIRWINCWNICLEIIMFFSLHKKWSFLLRISSVNATKSAGNCGFGHVYWRNPSWITSFFVQCFSLFYQTCWCIISPVLILFFHLTNKTTCR